MGYEEVETVLPKDFVPRPDPIPAPAPSPIKAAESPPAPPQLPEKTSEVESLCSVASSGVSSGYGSGLEGSSSKKKKRRNMMSRIKSSWRSVRSARKRSKSKTKKEATSKKTFASIKKVDSNATEIRSNTKKAVEERVEENREEVDEKIPSVKSSSSLPPLREGSPANTTVTACTNDTDNNKLAESESFPQPESAPLPESAILPDSVAGELDLVKDYSVEIGDEHDQFEVGIVKESEEPAPEAVSPPLTKTRSTDSASSRHSTSSKHSSKSLRAKTTNPSKQVEEVDDASQSVRSRKANDNEFKEDKNRALVPVGTSVVPSGRPAGVTADYSTGAKKSDEFSSTAAPKSERQSESPTPEGTNMLVVKENSEKRKWVKKVSLSIGGYKTSFQFSDPMTNLAQTVNDALDVVSDQALVDEAKALDDIGDKVEDERDYDENPTKLFMYLQQRAWGLALTQLKKSPDEAKVWVYRKQSPGKAANVPDGYKSRALVVQSQALVVHEGGQDKLRWKLLPLHASIVLGAPPEVILEIIKAYPAAARKPDERGSLPVHLAASRLDVDPEGEKIVLQLFGAYTDSIEIKDRKGRTPPELAKLARMRKDAENRRRINAFNQEELGVEKTASSFAEKYDEEDDNEDDENKQIGGNEGGKDDDDVSIKSNRSGRWNLLKSKSTDTADKRKKKKTKGRGGLLSRAKSVDERELRSKAISFDESCKDDNDDEMGPGFAILKPSKSYEQRLKTEMEESNSEEEEDAEAGASPAGISKNYVTPRSAPGSTDYARSIPLPMSFCEDDNRSPTPSIPPTSPGTMTIDVSECNSMSPTTIASNTPNSEPKGFAAEDESEPPNEALRVLLEKAAEYAGRGGEDVTEYLKILEDEWVTDVEALRRLDGETLDCLLPILLSREVQRLMNFADNIDDKFLTEDKGNDGKWVRESRERGRSPYKKKIKKRPSRRSMKKSAEPRRISRSNSPPEAALNTINEESDDDALSVVTEVRSRTGSGTKVRINDQPTEMEPTEQIQEEELDETEASSEFDNDLHIRKTHANLIADARKKFPTRESLEDAIRERQAEVEAAVNSGFDVDKQTLSRAALADDEVRKLLPLRLILPTVADLTEMVGVLQVHKENALRNLNLNKAVSIQTEIDELNAQITEEERYIMKKRMNDAKCITCGESFPNKKKMIGILRTNEQHCPKCKEMQSTSNDERSVGSSGSKKNSKKQVLTDSETDDDSSKK